MTKHLDMLTADHDQFHFKYKKKYLYQTFYIILGLSPIFRSYPYYQLVPYNITYSVLYHIFKIKCFIIPMQELLF